MAETNNFNPTKVPTDYALCLNRKCPLASSCLRQLVEQCVTNTSEFWTIVSPKRIASQQGDCAYYRSSVKVQFAKGFVDILGNLPNKQTKYVIARLINLFSRRTYYRIRKGEHLLSPDEQQKVLAIFKEYGANGSLEFDSYVKDYCW